MTNQVGNLTIYPPEAENGVGYIDLLNLKYWVELEETPDATYHNFADNRQEGE
jgi:hypothetical protein